MKKILLLLVALLTAANLCFAADGGALNKAQKSVDTMLAVFEGSNVPDYGSLASVMAAPLKEKFGAKEYEALQKQVKEKFGRMTEAKFVVFERFDKADRLTYLGSYTKEKIVTMFFGFDKNGKLMDFALAPHKQSPKPEEKK